MTIQPLQYNISDWHQLSQCKSNTSSLLTIVVADVKQGTRLIGLRISILDTTIGTVFSYMINPTGDCILNEDVPKYNLDTSTILAILRKFGFFVTYDRRANLSSAQLQCLMTVNQLNYQKLRWLSCHTGEKYLIVFNAETHPDWLSNTFVASHTSVLNAVMDGSAINLTNNPEVSGYDWSWLDYVANIDDILADNVPTN